MKVMRGPKPARGFTLIEVLIALAIVAMSVGALLGTLTSAASNISYLRDKTLAEWVALNRLAEIRTAVLMPDKGKRAGNTVMGGMRWQWEQEVVELPIKGMFRVDVRARPTGEAVDDTRDTQKATAQKDPDSSPSGGELASVSWTTTVTGVVSSARSPRASAIATPWRGNITGGPNNPGTGGPGNTPGAPGVPGSPNNPGKPGNPGNPRTPPPQTTPRTDM
ncbi:MAG: type II secretion system minor pseudopilin GspI [Pseudomonadota bacterium]